MKIDIERLKTDAAYWDEVAPEGATHFWAPSSDWYRVDVDGATYAFYDNQWRVPCHEFRLGKEMIIPRPAKPAAPEWDGDEGDLPPIGTVAYCRTSQTEEKILAHDTISNPNMAIVCDNSGYWGAEAHHWEPLRTKEQRERDELAKLLDDAQMSLGSFWTPQKAAEIILSRYNLEPKP